MSKTAVSNNNLQNLRVENLPSHELFFQILIVIF